MCGQLAAALARASLVVDKWAPQPSQARLSPSATPSVHNCWSEAAGEVVAGDGWDDVVVVVGVAQGGEKLEGAKEVRVLYL